ncbi:MAG TPA: FHA domain-containing protein [Gemmataceae bacterium]|nr:FHA domain-containing protein [Gemmataceae bacterium]
MSNTLLAHFNRAVGLTGPIEFVITRPDSGRSERFPLDQPFALIGRAGKGDLALEHPSVSRRHAFLQAVGDRAMIVDLGSRTGVRWPDGPRRAGWLAVGEAVRIGVFEVRLTACPGPAVQPSDAADPLAARPLTTPLADLALEVDPGTGRPTVYPMPHWVALAGRAGVCAVRAADDELLPHHCAFVKTGEDLFVVDLSADRRTRVNGAVARAARLRDGDLVRAGSMSVVVRAGYTTPAPPAASKALVVVPPADPFPGLTPAVLTESVAAAVSPLNEMMRQFQECMTVMARMFATIQQEQAAVAREQLAEFQAATRELRAARAAMAEAPFAEAAPVPAAGPDRPPPEHSAPPPPKPLTPGAAGDLADAHAWLMKRLAEMGSNLGTPSR